MSITACIDINPQHGDHYARLTKSESFTRFEDCDPDSYDAVAILLPHDLHERYYTRALKLGKHVLAEKPMAPTLAECKRILSVAEETQKTNPGQVFMIGENSQYWPEVVRAKELLDEGAIGELVTARGHYFESIRNTPFGSPEEWLGWRKSLKITGGGVCLDGGQHWIRPLRYWMGEVTEVVGTTGRLIEAMEGESLAHALLRFESGKVASYQATVLEKAVVDHENCPWFRLTGTLGEIVIYGRFTGGMCLTNPEYPEGKTWASEDWGFNDSRIGYLNSFTPQYDDFLSAVINGTKPIRSAAYSLGDLRTALALYKSAQEGRWVSTQDEALENCYLA